MLYTVAKLTALLSGVAMAADHSVPHLDETEHMEEEIEPHRFDSLLCSDVFGVISSFCDSCSIKSIRLTNWTMYRSFNRVFLKDWQKWMKAPLTDDWKVDQFEKGLIECDCIDQIIESIDFSQSIPVCFTPLFCGKLIQSRRMVDPVQTESEPSLRLQPHCEMPLDLTNRHFRFHGDSNSFVNDHLIGKLNNQQALMNVRTGKVTEFPPCKEARFLNDRIIVLFHGDKFQFYDLFDGEGDVFGETGFPLDEYAQWSVTQDESGFRAIIVDGISPNITFFTLDNDQMRWVKKTIEYEQSGVSEMCFSQFLSPDGSILIAVETFEGECSLINIVDTHTETIQHNTVMLPYDYFHPVKVSRNGALFQTQCNTAVLLDLNTIESFRLTESGKSIVFYWISDSRFWLSYVDQTPRTMDCIRSLKDPFGNLGEFNGLGYPLSQDFVFSKRKVSELVERDFEQRNCR